MPDKISSIFNFVKEAKDALTLGIASLIVTTIFSVSNCMQQAAKNAADLELERTKQTHEIRTKYLELALTERSESYEKERVLRFLKRLRDDTTISQWAADELDTIALARQVRDTIRSVATELAKKNPSIPSNSQTLARLNQLSEKLADLEKSARITPTIPQCRKGTIRSKTGTLDELCVTSESLVNFKTRVGDKLTWVSGLYYAGINDDKPAECECIPE